MIYADEVCTNTWCTDTGGLMQNHASTIYPYTSPHALLDGESRGGAKSPLPQRSSIAVTERPNPLSQYRR